MQVTTFVLLYLTTAATAFMKPKPTRHGWSTFFAGPKAIHTEFTVEKATPEMIAELNVKSWGVWSTEGSVKYKTGIKSPLKVYDCNELSYIISGSMEITPEATGIPVKVNAGDFVTFPGGFACYWFVKETIVKNYYLYWDSMPLIALDANDSHNKHTGRDPSCSYFTPIR